MKNKKSHYGLLLSLLLHGIAALVPVSAVAAIQLEGVWDDYASGTHGVWELTYQTSSADALFRIDFDGDFLGNGSDPEPLSLSGYTDASGTAFLNTVAHQTFGDVSATLSSQGVLQLNAGRFPDSSINALNLEGILTDTGFDFSYDVSRRSGVVSYGLFMTEFVFDVSGDWSDVDVLDDWTLTANNTPLQSRAVGMPHIDNTPSQIPLPGAFVLLVSGLAVLLTIKRDENRSV